MTQRGATLAEDIGRGITRVRRLFISEAGRRLETQGQTVMEWQVLNYLNRSGPVPQGVLAEGIGQHAPGVSRLVEDMERARLVRRVRDSEDRRRVFVGLAPKGKSRLEAGRPLVEAAVEQVLAPLDAADRRTLRDLLFRLLPQG